MLFSQKFLRYVLGTLWLLDAIFQVQPQMFTTNMINSVLLPTLSSQPAPVAVSLHMIILTITQHLVFFNLLIAVVQAEIGLFLISSLWVRQAIILSIVWALIVWYGGEGMNMLLTGMASALTGAPGAVLFYPLLGLLVYPRKATPGSSSSYLLAREHFRWVLAGFWICAALLQLQPFWWQPEHISQVIGAMTGLGGFNTLAVDPVLVPLARLTLSLEVPLNSALVVIFLALGSGLALVKPVRSRPLLVLSILLSLLIWWGAQGFGMILTGMATDFNSGLLLLLMTLACWPSTRRSLKPVIQHWPLPSAQQAETPGPLTRSAAS